MKELVVISGKGGTGKTSITAAFASLAKNAVLADCDVDAADLHLVLGPKIIQESEFSGGKQASIVTEKCIGCGICIDVCREEAVSFHDDLPFVEIDAERCTCCGICAHECPNEAIALPDLGRASF